MQTKQSNVFPPAPERHSSTKNSGGNFTIPFLRKNDLSTNFYGDKPGDKAYKKVADTNFINNAIQTKTLYKGKGRKYFVS
eukprot:CAMPEP_0170554306 /NCGR_PEP_ID=MMETSP0211-20121228/12160_1 /TAXON_ID=311385 /ORGANISM="Pseudokeronopsis sp., Strain OXSARD2" /LENGTH=79 /DNA_ID=CAMNT_0010863257 /DNA_START=532 /DNA_END=771 /DNA_ORIENTATION=-